MTWIPILEKIPPDSQQVLIFDDVNEYIIGYYHHTGRYFIGSVDGARINNGVSGWLCLNCHSNLNKPSSG